MSNLCPKCGAELFEGGRFCMVCGLPLDRAAQQPMPQQAPPVENMPQQPVGQPEQMPFVQPQAQPEPMPYVQPQPAEPQEQKPRNMTQEFIEKRKREKGIY